ncbi:hypothetical protein J7413_16515 [Shimia sp. R10_1]|uniref:hypothetical protein n=1 Tax=Shimia sp. R10_1 TaxID=2821095 RepID=UPI001ADAE40E|nr:hypothetical protein [Shimia sp. R10_1]MBO9475152.1 hypothetical protein [Shimia sp. R10_1]
MRVAATIVAMTLTTSAWASEEPPVSQELVDLVISVGEANNCLITRDLAKAELLPAGFTGRSFEKTLRYLEKAGQGEIDAGTFKLNTEACQ